jgi:hypothetical protein
VANVLGQGFADGEDGGGAFPELFRTTVGNLGEGRNNTQIILPGPLCQFATFRYPNCAVPKSHIAVMEASLDALACLIFAIGWVVLGHCAEKEVDKVDADSVEVTDFAVFLPTIPRWFTAKRIHQHFDRVLNGPTRDPSFPPFRISAINVVDDGFKRLAMFRNKAAIDQKLGRINSEIEQLRLERLAFGDTECCKCCNRNSKLDRLMKKRRALEEQEAAARKTIDRFAAASSDYRLAQIELQDLKTAKAENKSTGCCRPSLDSEIQRKEREIESLAKRAREEGRDPDAEETENSVAAFVVFNNDEDYREALKLYRGGACCQSRQIRVIEPSNEAKVGWTESAASEDVTPWRVSAPVKVTKAGKRIAGTVPIRVLQAPDPTTVLWENLNVTSCQQCIRRSITSLIALSLLLGSFVALYVASAARDQQAADKSLLSCSAVSSLINATKGVNGTLELRTAYGQFDPTAQPVWPTVKEYLVTRSPSSPFLNKATQNATMQNCYCKSIPWNKMDIGSLTSHLDIGVCPMQYCSSLAVLEFHRLPSEQLCLKWLEDFSIQFGLTLAASFATVLVNLLLNVVINALASFDAYYSRDELQSSLAWKALLTQFFNTALLVAIVNAFIPGISREVDRARLHEDFSRNWYASVGTALLFTMGLQIITPHISMFVMAFFLGRRRRKTLAPSQLDLNAWYMGPEFNLPARYAQIFTFILVALVYSAGMPILLWFALVACIITYWVDLYGFTKVYRTPARTTGELGKVMISSLPFGVLLHIGVAIWVFANPGLFASDAQLQALLDSQKASALGAVGADTSVLTQNSSIAEGYARLTNSSAFPLLAVLVLLVVYLALRFVWTLFRTTLTGMFKILTCGRGCACCIQKEEDIPLTFESALSLAETKLPGLNNAVEEAVEARDEALRSETPSAEVRILQMAVEEAREAFDEVKKVALTTLKDYNMFRVPRIMDQFHLPPSFADSFNQLCDLRHWSPAKAEAFKRKERNASLATAGLTTASNAALASVAASVSAEA